MNFHVRSYGAELAEHYAAVRARLGCLPLIPQEPVLLLPYFAPPAEPHIVVDLIPNQRGQEVKPIGAVEEAIAARRALMMFARLREENPSHNSVRHLQVAVAA